DEQGEPALLLQHYGVDRLRLAARVEAELSRLRTGNSGRPVFAEALFQWLEDAWLIVSVESGAVRLRSGAILAQLAARPGRYTSDVFPELDQLPKEELRRGLDQLLSATQESLELEPSVGLPRSDGESRAGQPEALRRYAACFTEKARAGKIDPIFGRDREIRQMVDVLARRRKNNPLIVGEAGVGKTALVEGLALAIAAGDVPDTLRAVELWGLDMGLLQAGA